MDINQVRRYLSILAIPLDIDFTKNDIISSYKTRSKLFHPDLNKSNNSNSKFIELNDAYNFILDNFDAVKKILKSDETKKHSIYNDKHKENNNDGFFSRKNFLKFNYISLYSTLLFLVYLVLFAIVQKVLLVNFILFGLFFIQVSLFLLFELSFEFSEKISKSKVYNYNILGFILISFVINFFFYLQGHLVIRNLVIESVILDIDFNAIISNVFIVFSLIYHVVFCYLSINRVKTTFKKI